MTTFSTHVFVNTVFLLTFLIALIFLFFIVISRNPISVVVLLIGFFLDIAILFIFIGADYIGVLFLLIYAGAVSIILLFAIMLLDMKDILIRVENHSTSIKILFFLFFCILALIFIWEYSYVFTHFLPRVQYVDWFKILYMKTNIEVVGSVLYELFIFQFLAVGLLLFVVMILVISLIINYNFITKKQDLFIQLNVRNDFYKR